MSKDAFLELERKCAEMAKGASPEARQILEKMAADFAARSTSPAYPNLAWYITAGATLVFVYAMWALYFKHTFFDPTPKGEVVVRMLLPFEQYDNANIARNRRLQMDLAAFGDDANVAGDTTSPIIVYEDGKPLGPAHNSFRDIREIGNGRFTHYKTGEVIFSASDNSDPNTNGRTYWAVKP
jgi:hypothetical protein